jgi:hypothetical protein
MSTGATEPTVAHGQATLPLPAGSEVKPCERCQREFVSDRTSMAEMGFCMLCRPHIQVSCVYCGGRCAGRYDGQAVCQKHREMSSEELMRVESE